MTEIDGGSFQRDIRDESRAEIDTASVVIPDSISSFETRKCLQPRRIFLSPARLKRLNQVLALHRIEAEIIGMLCAEAIPKCRET